MLTTVHVCNNHIKESNKMHKEISQQIIMHMEKSSCPNNNTDMPTL